ncbi:amino acid ABC transporter ATP-binding protein [Aerococcus urinaehominis]|uniref:Amino acid ABC transporter ATP-binding protein n=1 Tax=Aerococcus urinaehominis TaxID=128944 RepID=A0A0X8FM57_9LACT|nr:amino acid ABC transporter ATP-binding protein [Aerococcus urinaehominis]AMB99830.1 amino acid ABC transporter ATP-binding protein [Aerococcus urinaehominis]SDM55564.1 putative amino-acid transport system ATP-binding protein [Aerococcus urinaehominis]
MIDISIKNLSKRFGDNQVLQDINIDINKGDVVAIIGPSGSGKSTLLRCLNLLETIDSGSITINDVKVEAGTVSKEEARKLRQQSAMVFQQYHLFKNKTALENVTLAPIKNGLLDKAAAEKQGLALLKSVGLSDQRNQYPATLSGGQQQRVSIARALAVDPEIILLDEPTSALDPELVNEVLTTIERLTELNKTIVIVTHEINFARRIADRVIFMEKAQIVEDGTPDQVLGQPSQQRTREFLAETIVG